MSWFNQLQDQLARSVEEASDLISTVNRLDLLNLDEMAIQQEEDAKLEELEEEQDEEDADEDEDKPGEEEAQPDAAEALPEAEAPAVSKAASLDETAPETSVDAWEVVGEDRAEELSEPSPAHAADPVPPVDPRPTETVKPTAVTPKKEGAKKEKKEKKPKDSQQGPRKTKKPKKAALNFFGIRSSAEDDKPTQPTMPVEVAFDISTLWDHDAPVSEVVHELPSPAPAAAADSAPEVVPEPTPSSSSSFIANIFTPSASAPAAQQIKVVLQKPHVSFFDNVDAEVDLENDPILKKVEENKLQAALGNTNQQVDYFSYFRQFTGQNNAPRLPAHVSIVGIGSNSSQQDEEITTGSLAAKLSIELRLVWAQFIEQWTPLKQQTMAVYDALQWSSVGSVCLSTASMSYVLVQMLLALLFFVLKVILALVIYLLSLMLLAVRVLFALRQDRCVLPCTVETFSNNRQWVREHLGNWASRFLGTYLRTNYGIGLATGALLLLSYWQFQKYLDNDETEATK